MRLKPDEREIAKSYEGRIKGCQPFLTDTVRRAMLAEEVMHTMTMLRAAKRQMDISYYVDVYLNLKSHFEL